MREQQPTNFEIMCARFYRKDPDAKVYASPSTGRVHIEFGDGSRARFERQRGETTERFAEWIKSAPLPDLETSCWHFGTVLLPDENPPHCEGCPGDACEVEGCSEDCCHGSSETVSARNVADMTEFVVPKPEVIVKSVKAGTYGGKVFTALARTAGAYHERIRVWRVAQREAGKSQDYIDAKSNGFTYLLNEALEQAGELLDNEPVATPLGPVAVRLLPELGVQKDGE